MKTDEFIDWIDILENENKALTSSNAMLIFQVSKLRESLASALNLMDPEQTRIIHNDIFTFLNNNQHA